MTSTPSPAQNAATVAPPQKPPAVWSHEETLTLIQIYQEKWYSLNRTPLKSSHWEEVAHALASPSKSPTQCRHKIEKLRKRYRAETLKIPQSPLAWVYFPIMHRLEHGQPLEIENNNAAADHMNDRDRNLGDHEKSRAEKGKRRRNEDEDEEVRDFGGGMREFVETFVKMEKMKMEIMRENERFKIEMENKRLQLILVSHQKSVDLISKTFGLNNNATDL